MRRHGLSPGPQSAQDSPDAFKKVPSTLHQRPGAKGVSDTVSATRTDKAVRPAPLAQGFPALLLGPEQALELGKPEPLLELDSGRQHDFLLDDARRNAQGGTVDLIANEHQQVSWLIQLRNHEKVWGNARR